MKKVAVFYFAAGCCLFLALFAAFALGGGLVPPPEAEAPPAAAVAAPLPAPPPAPRVVKPGLDYANLWIGAMYRVSHATPLHADPDELSLRQEELPARGIFLVDGSETREEELWYRVTVNNGRKDYGMYLRAKDLNLQDVKRFGRGGAPKPISQEEALALAVDLFGARRAATARAEPEPAPETDSSPDAFADALAYMQGALSEVSSQGLGAAALAAGILTVGTLVTIVCISWLYNLHRMRGGGAFVDLASEMAEEFADEERAPPGSGDF